MPNLVTEGDVYLAQHHIHYEGDTVVTVTGSLKDAKDFCRESADRHLAWTRHKGSNEWSTQNLPGDTHYSIQRISIGERLY